jgi:protein disulfide-isomerase-like protein
MPSNNSNSRNSNGGKMTIKKDNLVWLGLIALAVIVVAVLYYMQKKRAEGFESPKQNSNALIKATSLTPNAGECVVALFYADWCGHCKSFKPEFESAMSKLNGKANKKGKKLRLVKIDCDAEKDLAKQYDISGYPTVKILNDDGSIVDYDGPRSADGLTKYLMSDD